MTNDKDPRVRGAYDNLRTTEQLLAAILAELVQIRHKLAIIAYDEPFRDDMEEGNK